MPVHVAAKLLQWVATVEKYGLEEVRKTRGYHDEPLRGQKVGMRSIRLSQGYRAYYRVERDTVLFVLVIGVDKHLYR